MTAPDQAEWLARVGIDPERALTTARYDWVYTFHGSRLHALDSFGGWVTDVQWEDVVLACGRRFAYAHIPGFVSRLHMPRCVRCCDRMGYPRGIGSPKNDDQCRRLLGLSPLEVTHEC